MRTTASRFAAASRIFISAAISLMMVTGDADAKRRHFRKTHAPAATFDAGKYAAIVIDVNSGKTLFAANPDALRHPASLTKMMTLYMLFDGLKNGKFSKNTQIPVSAHAARQAPSKLGLKPGQSISVETAILALVTKSANDAAAASGEFIGGTEAHFAEMMTAKARQLGMSRTTYRNASGLPDPNQWTTARDLSVLGVALRHNFPQYYAYFSTRSFSYGRSRIGNHNKLLGRVAGVDGIKTGYTRASGFNLVTSVKQGNRSLVAVVMGGRSGRARDQQMASLVQKYTPSASTRANGTLFAFLKPKTVEKAEPIYDVENPVLVEAPKKIINRPQAPVLAYAAPASKPKAVEAVEAEAAIAPTPAKKPKTLKTENVETAVAEPEAVDPITTSSNDIKGWVIQIAAADSEAGAYKLLSGAKAKGGKALGNAKPFTQAVEKGAATLYRARFSGFETKTAAWNACAALKKQKVSCYALNN